MRLALVREEARSTRNAQYERVESKPVITQVAGTVENLNGRLPMGKGKISERISFPLSGTLLPSVLTDYTLRREYKLKVKAVLSGMNGSIDKEFTIIITQEK